MKENRIPPEALQFFREQGKRGGQIGGKKRAANMTPDQRSEAARRMVQARIAKRKAAIEAGTLTPRPKREPPPASEPQRNRCVRCGYEWTARKANSPKCPGCRCYRWDITEDEHKALKREARFSRPRATGVSKHAEVYPCQWCGKEAYGENANERHENACKRQAIYTLKLRYGFHYNTFVLKVQEGALTHCNNFVLWLRMLDREDLIPRLKPAE